MQVTRTSIYSGNTRTLELPITEEMVCTYGRGAMIQDAFPGLTDAQREFYMTGITEEEWLDMFSHDGDEDTDF